MKDDKTKKLDEGKRDFLKKIASTAVFSVPVIQSFPIDDFSNGEAEAQSFKILPPVSPVGP